MRVETWKDCPGFVGTYEVSDHGFVRRIRHRHGGPCERVLKPRRVHGGMSVTLCDRTRIKTFLVKRLVAEVFIGPAQGRCVLIVNRNDADCSVTNLKYGERRALPLPGELNGRAKMTDDEARLALSQLTAGQSVVDVARRFSVSERAIEFLRDRKHWKNL